MYYWNIYIETLPNVKNMSNLADDYNITSNIFHQLTFMDLSLNGQTRYTILVILLIMMMIVNSVVLMV